MSAPDTATAPSLVEHWEDLAACLGADPDLFFPERGASTREAKEVCRGCRVRVECLEHSMTVPERFGIWGGMAERERRRLRRTRTQAARAAAIAGLPAPLIIPDVDLTADDLDDQDDGHVLGTVLEFALQAGDQ